MAKQDDVAMTETVLSDGSKTYAVSFQGKVRFDCIDRAAAERLALALGGYAIDCSILRELAADRVEEIYREGWEDGAGYDGDRDPSANHKAAEDEAWQSSFARQLFTNA
jgi:hypothetical protein